METLSYTVSMTLFGVILVETFVSLRARRAVRGSRERYVALTQRRILSWIVNIGFAAQGIVGLVIGQPLSLLSLVFAVYLSYQEIKNHKDDDDWFNGRMKKIWKGVKKAFAPPIKVPSPVAAPSPVFG
ncbi:hypothetical protein AX769_11530 [Frondihabitans sp. PAMC 28766]|uniref:hypothetical protein n=1 Tax=Frondihabitans sp. PAMC 28766 TaxID=1795630 RepID=UPI00078E8271|nr:hypothetical protein [Frondihabitans sp. PAMC 28766]AMM20657.1 hypothetical protein AX769_11530 [Frondihabitans sp. PAMC 28766]